MPRFTTRIELYGSAPEEVYYQLHALMEDKGFFTAIKENGENLKLPKAEYISFHGLSTLNVVELARQIAESVWEDVAVLVTYSEERVEYYNLRPLLY